MLLNRNDLILKSLRIHVVIEVKYDFDTKDVSKIIATTFFSRPGDTVATKLWLDCCQGTIHYYKKN